MDGVALCLVHCSIPVAQNIASPKVSIQWSFVRWMDAILEVIQMERVAVLPFWPHWFIRWLAPVSCFLSSWNHRVIDNNGLGSIHTCIFLIILHSVIKMLPFPFSPYLFKLCDSLLFFSLHCRGRKIFKQKLLHCVFYLIFFYLLTVTVVNWEIRTAIWLQLYLHRFKMQIINYSCVITKPLMILEFLFCISSFYKCIIHFSLWLYFKKKNSKILYHKEKNSKILYHATGLAVSALTFSHQWWQQSGKFAILFSYFPTPSKWIQPGWEDKPEVLLPSDSLCAYYVPKYFLLPVPGKQN